MKNNKFHTETNLTHDGRDPSLHEGFVNPPIQRGSTIIFENAEDLHRDDIKTYGLEGSSTQDRLRQALTSLMGAQDTILTSSGLQAITLVLMTFLKSGDHVLVTDNAYGPTRRFCDKVLKNYGIETTYYAPRIGAGIEALIKPNTKLIMLESPGSLTMEVEDLPSITQIARTKNIITAIDDTWSAGLYLKPLDLGVDLSIQALTKYQAGHSDVLAGSVTSKNQEYIDRLENMHRNLGIGTSAEDAWLCLRGLKTMAVRMAHQDGVARRIASWLGTQPSVTKILHPALPSSPDYEIWKRDFTGAAGLFSFITKPVSQEKIYEMMNSLELFSMGFSWGGFESLAIYSDPRTIRSAQKWTEEGTLIRLSIGLENEDDLKADLERALSKLS